ncbi:ribonuclease Oy isoform X2 [Octopus sinensis]|uniref:Ribonuclease Oy isoform X2 n=1 Tax=Octopus sinensis TaxID=2607531 RepID=A0A7E6F7L4_9MOLL|nr:ribonuclease Oy isoform X2 [Octopus sinensis]
MWRIKCILSVSLIAVSLHLYIPTISARDVSFDSFVFSQQWLPTFCMHATEEERACKIPDMVKNWVIHGIWPESSKKPDPPAFCNSSWHFNESDIKSIEDELKIRWPNVFTSTGRTSFWKHEWEKHGTCAVDKPYIFNEKSYFEMGIKLNKQYNLRHIYERSGIIAVNYTSYKCEDFRNVIKKNWNVESIITCVHSKEHRQYILQTEICFDKSFKPIDCKRDQKCLQCSQKENIWYPPLENTATPDTCSNQQIENNFFTVGKRTPCKSFMGVCTYKNDNSGTSNGVSSRGYC